MATPLQKKVDAIQAKVDAQNAAKTPVVPETVTPLQTKVDAIQAKVDAQNLANPVVPKVNPTIEAIKAARAKVITPAPGEVAPVNTAPLTAGQEVAKKNLENRPVPVDTTKIGTGVGENFVPYKGEQATVIPDTTGKVNADGTPVVPTPTETKTETKAPTKPLETTTPSPVVVQNEDEAFKTLMAGGMLADTRENNAFKKTYGQFNYYNGLDNKTLSNKVAGGEVGSKFMNMLARFNPTKYAEVVKQSEDITKVNDINANAQRLYNTANGTPQPAVTKTSDQMMQDLINGVETVPEKYSDIVAKAYADNPEIKEKADKLAVIDDKVDTIDTEIDKMYETYRTQYPDVPQAMLMGMVNRATYGLTQERNGLVKESKLLYSQYKDEKDQIDQGIQYDIAQQDKLDSRRFELQKVLYGDKKEEEIDLRELAQAEDVIAETRKYDEAKADEMELLNIQKAIANIGLTPVPGANYETLLKQFASGMSADKQYERNQAAAALAERNKKSASDYVPIKWTDADGVEHQALQNINDPTDIISGDKYASQTEGTTTLDFIKSKEGFRENAYLDSGGVPTVGYGFTSLNGKPVVMGQTISREQADAELQNQIDSKYSNWKNIVNVSLSPSQEAALTSLEYNLGPGVWKFENGKKILDAVNKGDFQTAANILGTSGIGTTVKSTGQVLPGLQKRRKEEAQLLLSGKKEASPYEGFIDTILGSGTFTKDQKNTIKNSIRSGEDPSTVIRNQAKNIMGQTSATKLTDAETARDTFNDLAKSIQDFYDAGGQTSYVKGNFEDMYNAFGEVDDPKLVELASKVRSTVQAYRNAVSGTAYSVQEGQDIDKIFPGINKSEGLNNAIIKARKEMFDSTIDARYRSTLRGGYDKLLEMEKQASEPELTGPEIKIVKDIKTKYPNATDEEIDDALAFYKSLGQ